jgi:hypothetical protein
MRRSVLQTAMKKLMLHNYRFVAPTLFAARADCPHVSWWAARISSWQQEVDLRPACARAVRYVGNLVSLLIALKMPNIANECT